MTSQRLSEKANAALSLPVVERIAYIRKKKWFGYSAANKILSHLEDLLTYPKSDRMPNLLLVGDTNNGKTSLVKEFLARYPPGDNPGGDTIRLPVFYMHTPPVPDEGRFYDEILGLLFAPYKSTDKIAKKEKAVLDLLARIDVKMVVIDEIHNLLAGPITRQQALLNTIKNLGNKLMIPIVALGTTESFRAIHTDSQLANRFRSVVLPKWEYGDEYRRLLASFEHTLPLKDPSFLAKQSLAQEVHRMSEGTIGEIVSVLCDAAVYALRNDRESISQGVLSSMDWTPPSRRSTML